MKLTNLLLALVLYPIIISFLACQKSVNFEAPVILQGNHAFLKYKVRMLADSFTIFRYRNGFTATLSKGIIRENHNNQLILQIDQEKKWSLNTGDTYYPWTRTEDTNYRIQKINSQSYSIQIVENKNTDLPPLIDRLDIVDTLSNFEKKYMTY